jgi:uncharacterized protein
VTKQTVTVEGVGHASRAPDVLRIQVAVETPGDSVDQALAGTNRAMDAVLTALRDAGVAGADLRTSSLSIRPLYDKHGRLITGYLAGNGVTATLRDLEQAGTVISAVAGAGGDATRVSGLHFDVDDDADLLEQARQSAVADARRRAETYATAAGRSVGRVLRISEVDEARPVPVRSRMMAMAEAAGPVPLEGGLHEVTAAVTVEWALA